MLQQATVEGPVLGEKNVLQEVVALLELVPEEEVALRLLKACKRDRPSRWQRGGRWRRRNKKQEGGRREGFVWVDRGGIQGPSRQRIEYGRERLGGIVHNFLRVGGRESRPPDASLRIQIK